MTATSAEARANAGLIAAAPSLLLAAKEAALVIGDIVKTAGYTPADSPVLMRLMDAINEAEGTK